jgi:hypothetical protein
MSSLSWLSTADALSPADLTVRAQALPLNDDGTLRWDTFFPRENVPSIVLNDLSALDYRPTAEHREWNANGRRIPLVIPARRKVVIVPIEAESRIDEQEMQRLTEAANGNEALIRDQVAASIPARTQLLTMADYRRIEVATFNAWTKGNIVQRMPENAAVTYTASFGFSSTRLTTAGTAWNDGAVNAYDLLQAWVVAAEALVGPLEGAMTRQKVIDAVLADAPDMSGGVLMTRSGLNDRIAEDVGHPFTLVANESTVDVFDDGGSAYTRTNVFPAGYIVAIPQGKRVGRTAFAPVVRAYELATAAPQLGIDVNGVTLYYVFDNDGKGVTLQCQVNALPIPDETALYSTNTQVT